MDFESITISKKPGVKNCVRISKQDDIPDFLKEAVKIEDGVLVLDCLEGEERCPLGSVIAFEQKENGKMNVWNKANWKETTMEKNGVFYEIPKVYKAIRVTDEIPQSIVEKLGDKFSVLPDGSFQIKTDWGLSTCAPYNGYLVIYGQKDDGSLDVNFLTKGTPSFEQYYVVENGELGQTLAEYDMQFEQKFGKRM